LEAGSGNSTSAGIINHEKKGAEMSSGVLRRRVHQEPGKIVGKRKSLAKGRARGKKKGVSLPVVRPKTRNVTKQRRNEGKLGGGKRGVKLQRDCCLDDETKKKHVRRTISKMNAQGERDQVADMPWKRKTDIGGRGGLKIKGGAHLDVSRPGERGIKRSR